jgi:hypothetical protein
MIVFEMDTRTAPPNPPPDQAAEFADDATTALGEVYAFLRGLARREREREQVDGAGDPPRTAECSPRP